MKLLGLVVLAFALGVAGVSQAAHGEVHGTTLSLTAIDLRIAESATISAHLHDDMGQPVSGAIITFDRETTFGWLVLGDRPTNEEGSAFLSYVPENPGTHAIRARFGGAPGLRPSETVSTVTVIGPGVDTPFPTDTAIAVVIAAVVGSIWGAYAFVALDLRGVWIAGGGVPRLRPRKDHRSP